MSDLGQVPVGGGDVDELMPIEKVLVIELNIEMDIIHNILLVLQ